MAKDHLTKNGVLAYNIIGKVNTQQKCILGSIYNSLKTCFPQVYLFPAASSKNVVLIATMAPEPVTLPRLTRRMKTLTASQRVTFPNFKTRIRRFKSVPPLSAPRSPILSDDFAPVDGLLKID
jgi:hypothetical protein